jgi:hypothetical protein
MNFSNVKTKPTSFKVRGLDVKSFYQPTPQTAIALPLPLPGGKVTKLS